ncbi:hypothetical protein KDA_32750 [Dictyobacter alpinus]|uniref:Uncharacterized protein n=1 Tax=Dictyobacter alpinus TaxID=2014873 RepID=A0A402B8U1_9CHLR|nr:hypothetical protein KDA_32750 [Dictyobacter alpinus]
MTGYRHSTTRTYNLFHQAPLFRLYQPTLTQQKKGWKHHASSLSQNMKKAILLADGQNGIVS